MMKIVLDSNDIEKVECEMIDRIQSKGSKLLDKTNENWRTLRKY